MSISKICFIVDSQFQLQQLSNALSNYNSVQNVEFYYQLDELHCIQNDDIGFLNIIKTKELIQWFDNVDWNITYQLKDMNFIESKMCIKDFDYLVTFDNSLECQYDANKNVINGYPGPNIKSLIRNTNQINESLTSMFKYSNCKWKIALSWVDNKSQTKAFHSVINQLEGNILEKPQYNFKEGSFGFESSIIIPKLSNIHSFSQLSLESRQNNHPLNKCINEFLNSIKINK